MLYQGTLLMAILNWAGLIINGLVAFMLPMILALKAIELKARVPHDVFLSVAPQAPVSTFSETSPFLSPSGGSLKDNESVDVEGRGLPASISQRHVNGVNRGPSGSAKSSIEEGGASDRSVHTDLLSNQSYSDKTVSRHGSDKHYDGTVRRLKANTIVEPLPDFLEGYRRELVVFMISSFAVIILTTIVEDAISGVLQPPIN